MNTIGSVEAFGRDLRYPLRALHRHRSFTLAVVMTLAVGLGANTAIFAVVDGVLIKPLPYPDAEQLVSLAHVAPGIKIAEANADVARMLPLWLNAWPIPSGPMDRAAMENWRIAPTLKPLRTTWSAGSATCCGLHTTRGRTSSSHTRGTSDRTDRA